MKNYKLHYLAFILLLAISFTSCDNSSGPDDDESPAVIEGRVLNLSAEAQPGDTMQTDSQPVEGATVQATRVTNDGTLEPIGEDSAQTDANGEFSLEIFSDDINDNSGHIVVRAEQDGQMSSTFVTAPVERGGTARSQPMNVESTGEAEVYQYLVAQGNIDRLSTADISAAVTGTVAADILADTSLAGDVASALLASEQASDEFYDSQGIDVSEEREEIQGIKTNAQIDYENRLSTTTEQGVEDAYDAFIEEYANAALEVEINPTAAAKAEEAGSRVLVNQLSALSDRARADIRMDAAFIKTYSLEAGVLEQLEALEVAQGSLENVEDASASARSQIRELEGEAAEDEIRQIFEGFQDAVVSAIDDEEDLDGAMFIAVNAAINDSGGAKPTLDSALQGNIDVLSVMDAYNRFYSEVEATVNDAAETGVAAYYTHLLILISAPA